MADTKKPGCVSQIIGVVLVALLVGGCRSCTRLPERRPPQAEPDVAAVPSDVPPAESLPKSVPQVAVVKSEPTEDAAPVEYVVVSDKPINNGAIRDVFVRIPQPIEPDDLRRLANQIKAASQKTYPKTSIFFLLPGQEPDKGAWARALFDPALSVNVIGGTAKDKERIDLSPILPPVEKAGDGGAPESEIVGVWYLSLPAGSSHRITLFRRDGIPYLRKVYGDGSSGEYEVMPHGKHRYAEDNSFGDWMQINERGNLDFYDGESGRRVLTASKTDASPPLVEDATTDESIAESMKEMTLAKLTKEIDKIGEEKKAVGKTRDRERMKKLIESEKWAKSQLLKARNKKPEEWLEDVRSRRGE
jgi:hypothetical protein